jgi:hypothetical protein
MEAWLRKQLVGPANRNVGPGLIIEGKPTLS